MMFTVSIYVDLIVHVLWSDHTYVILQPLHETNTMVTR